VDRKKVRFPKLRFKGSFQPTVIRKTTISKTEEINRNVDDHLEVEKSSSQPTPSLVAGSMVKEPKYNVKYRQTPNLKDANVYQVKRLKQDSSILKQSSIICNKQFYRLDPKTPSYVLVIRVDGSFFPLRWKLKYFCRN